MTACKRDDDQPEKPKIDDYSGFRIDGQIYAVDSLVMDTNGPGCSFRLYSGSHSGEW